MYNKLSSIILNAGKSGDFSDVFVAQPDAVKENLAGKVFILAQIGGKKAEGRKIFDFLSAAVEEYYYNDEKIFLRDKIEGLKIENIFEASLAKINKGLNEFLVTEKIRINPEATDLTLGVIYENKLHFSTFGRNKALLIYRRGENYELINVETNAAESATAKSASSVAEAKTPSLFSSVVSGEIPTGSYFVFASEALPEYLSGKEMINIITKLPPITAAEQIKNVLAKINNYVPFLGLIIKNTVGLVEQEIKSAVREAREEQADLSSVGASISSLNRTEQKTEMMLSPAGLISFSKIFRQIREFNRKRRTATPTQETRVKQERQAPSTQTPVPPPPLNIGKVNSLKNNLNLARSDSFMVKEEVFFKGEKSFSHGGLLSRSAMIFKKFVSVLNRFLSGFKNRFSGLKMSRRPLFIGLGVVILIFAASLIFTGIRQNRQAAKEEFDKLIVLIEEKESLIDAHLLYDDRVGAGTVLTDASALLTTLPQKTEAQREVYRRLEDKLKEQEEKINRVVRATAAEVSDLVDLGINNLVFADGRIYGAGGDSIYNLADETAPVKIAVAGAKNLNRPQLYNNYLYYWDTDQIIRLNVKDNKSEILKVPDDLKAENVISFKIFNDNLYSLVRDKNQVYRSNKSGATYGVKAPWFKEEADLSRARDMAIDGSIYILDQDGAIQKFYVGKAEDYKVELFTPTMESADKIIISNKRLYVFEAASKRLVVLINDKDSKNNGGLIAQYLVDSLETVSDIAIDEAGKFAYFLSGEKLYKVELNQ
jgi:hypothetical protein